MSQRWTPEQHELAVAHKVLCDEDLARLLSAIGPPRTAKGVKEYLLAKGIQRPKLTHGAAVSARQRGQRERNISMEALMKGMEAVRGWPTLEGCPERRDRKFVRAIYAEAERLGLLQRRAA